MSFYKQNLEAFIKLLKTQPKLFTEAKCQELLTLIEPLPDDIETLSTAIASWYEKYDPIVDAQLDILNHWNFTETPHFSAATARPGANSAATPTTINKELLKNAIVKTQPKAPQKPS
ncbi:hypothetical protein [Arthrospira platensis]|uniref:Uncharacterized protein n=1 Tax=Limnospira platensis NIES-46 TaxID=1236695 RepID=A0A5M3TCN3_LIMPL|nr:hypothetical protein [Arthrospira platensis]AMW26927.1 hypothetical protein AP285_01860 [Arthrospira platensis YZ]KDR54589.1 hypothetical protein APPUASWS_027245 [Arthrospira platensis str. Paraca]MBD2710437.1 hypothetical protein [Arthrospira platensis FACHB-835]MDF2211679.1 hypothetical protein [Arthrospira platensis NCB002]MDT9310758.1 hypothetical protein [Limnospira sp. Paracas R14]QQW29676.1 hypothetical protein AP9108_01925 [Arthrospira sp. PCC 9108]BAI88272.1 hypothetical protein 